MLSLLGIGGDAIARLRRSPAWLNSDKITEALAGSWTCSSAKARTQLGSLATSAPPATLAGRLLETADWYRLADWL